MDHEVVVRQKMTERYLLDELDSEARDEFEGHFFDCADCALDVHAGALFVDKSKTVLAERPVAGPVRRPISLKTGWFFFRPGHAVPLLVLFLAVIGYQNLVTLPEMSRALRQPQLLPAAYLNIGTYAADQPISVIPVRADTAFLLPIRIPPDGSYTGYTAELTNPAGRLEWSLAIPASTTQDRWPILVPAAKREAGVYALTVRGTTTAGESKEVGRASFELQSQK
jgi:hypothetical protein